MLVLIAMNKHFVVDHHIQTSILSMLMQEGPNTFSKIKPGDIENSLFMYHMRKLVSRGLVEKQDGDFTLTPEGARWLNKTGLKADPIQEPRCIVQFLVINKDMILISERLDHLATHMNKYLLPGGLHNYGSTSIESAQRVATSLHLSPPENLLCKIETINSTQSHSLADIYSTSPPSHDYILHDGLYTVS